MSESYPRQFGKYVLIAPLAQGGMGQLHLAFSGKTELRKLCVIKTILSHLTDEDFSSRFVDEAKVVVKLSHGNLIPVLEAGKVSGQVFLAMEYVDGKDLRDVWVRCLEKKRAFPLEVAIYVAREICRGLHYVHQYGELALVHRDVSPPNVMLSFTGEVRLTDFGVATSTIKLQKTAPGILLGKLSYMSPEQARNEKVNARADIYSVGVILWELLTNRRLLPPEGDLADRYERAVSPKFKPPSAYNRRVPPELDVVIARALAPKREQRYADAEQMRLELSTVLGKLAPAIDGSAVQSLLASLYANHRKEEQEQRRKLIDAVAVKAKHLLDSTGEIKRAVSPIAASELTMSVGHREASPSWTTDGIDPIVGDDSEQFDSPEDAPLFRRGTKIGDRYEIETLLGEGGMGRVYSATHTDIGKQVAVKILHPSFGRMPDLVSRFRREARAASKIGHPNIVEVYDSGKTVDGSIYFVMEYLTGIDLADVLAAEGTLTIPRIIRIGIQICQAVAAAHDAEIIHRDLKPENIYLCSREGTPDFVKVLDFGLAQNAGLEETRSERLTNPGMAMGTPEYMAPEQAAGKKTDHRADIYAVGTLLYEMLIGAPPHTGDNILEVFNRKAIEPITPPSELRKGIPPELERIVMWALQSKQEDRPQSMAQLAYELNKLTRGRAGAVASLLGLPDVNVRESNLQHDLGAGEITDMKTAPDTVSVKSADKSKSVKYWLIGAVVLSSLVGGTLVGLVTWRRPGEPASPAGALVVAADGSVAKSPVDGFGQPRSVDGHLTSLSQATTDAAESGISSDNNREPRTVSITRTKRAPRHRQFNKFLQRSYVREGRIHLQNKRFIAAKNAFRKSLRTHSGKGLAYLGLAEVEFQLGRFKQARRYARLALQHGAGWRARLVLGNVYYRLQKFRRAVEHYEAALKKKPNNVEVLRNLSAAKKRMGR